MAAAAPGVAPVRARFLTSKERFHAYLRAGGEEEEEEKEEKKEKKEEEQVSEPPAKRVKAEELSQDGESQGNAGEEEKERPEEKKRARGQNRSRPCMKPTCYEQSRLCPSVTQGCAGQCHFGPRCRFLHDVSQYLAAKPADLGRRCVLFDTFGRCPYGVTCRFGQAHLGDGHQNLVNAALARQWEGKVLVRNGLSKELQQQLRKRKFSFHKAEEFLRGLRAGKGGRATGGSTEGSNCTDHQEGPRDGLVLQEQGEDARAEDLPGSRGAEGAPKRGVLQGSRGAEGAANPEVLQSSRGAESAAKPDTLLNPQGAEGAANPEALQGSRGAEDAPTPEVLQNSQRAEGAANLDTLLNPQGAEGAANPEVLQNSQGAEGAPSIPTLGPLTDEDVTKLRPCEKKKLEIQGKLYLAPLTTCGNLPFRRICKRFGADVTCGEMAVCTNLLQGQSSEWALLKRHHTEDIFGVQLEGAFPDTMTKCAELLNRTIDVDFVDINVGCPIDLVYKKVLDVPLTVKIRTGVQEKVNVAHKIIPRIREWGASMVTLHGRSREQRYTRSADWAYIAECARLASPMPLFGNGDILSYEDANRAMQMGVSGIMIARGALIKPWLFTEIKEQRHWDISSRERLDILKDFTNYGLEHWGSDTQGVEKTRKFLLEWLSFLCRYIPVGLLEHLPQKINERPPYYLGRDYLETLMASQNVDDWIKISELLLGPVPPSFTFLPKHKANSYR
ncbi:tRNA-dihydrouridine(47) synthase [NAD(P)(+)]-like isoform X2 [Serinus canaria]|uniref:tRNA-dihydrouridine(47) synthase [NAD(P)(+)]-like isoform X2 n=1 Tax=Serinus canaria TaxID=9135 RepID=UPI0021CD02F7|nr:tRNA-dihydrouridine(47) synthase [NAD(P)(+)]-like isoform X2 [Serinus canaria]